MIQFLLIVAAVITSLVLQALDDILSQRGVISVLHGGLLGYGQVYVANELLRWGGGHLNWMAVILLAIAAMAWSYLRIMNTWTRWVCAFNLGIFVGVLYGGFDLV